MPKFFSSIFFKLMVIILVAGLGINLAIILFFGAFRHHMTRSYHPHLNRYVDYLLKEIGDPPDQDRARNIAVETDMIVAYEGKDQSWTTADTPIDVPYERLHIRHRDSRMVAGSHHGTYVITVKQSSGRLTFLLTHLPDAEKKIKILGTGLLLFITLLMAGAYLGIRWVLKPLRGLKHGVDQVARGELSHRVPLQRKDELRDLSDAFNTMTERLQHLIQSKEQLLLDVSHELRTPVTRMKVALAMMPETADRHTIAEDLEEIEKKITELLETARFLNVKATLKCTDVNLPVLIRKTAAQFETGRPAIRIAPMPEAVILRIDAEHIFRALKNVLDNAQKYSPEDAGPIELSMESDTSTIVISIRDHGIGISEQDLDFIFEPFYRADKARTPLRDGYGLGLSLAKNIVEAHGGTMVISSQLGRGTTVRIRLPRNAAPHGTE